MVVPTDRFVASTAFFVRYAETDALGVVHHSSYVVWLEEARSHYGRVRGTDYADFERAGFALSVVELQVQYRAPARYGDQIVAHCWVEALKSRTVKFGYEIAHATRQTVLVTGHTRHVCITHNGTIAMLPPEWRQRWL